MLVKAFTASSTSSSFMRSKILLFRLESDAACDCDCMRATKSWGCSLRTHWTESGQNFLCQTALCSIAAILSLHFEQDGFAQHGSVWSFWTYHSDRSRSSAGPSDHCCCCEPILKCDFSSLTWSYYWSFVAELCWKLKTTFLLCSVKFDNPNAFTHQHKHL